jgi:hypothetical protein
MDVSIMKLKFKTAKESIDFCLQKYKDINEYHQKLSELKKTWEETPFSPIAKLSDEDFDFLVSSFVKVILKSNSISDPIEGKTEVKVKVGGYIPIKTAYFKGPGYFPKMRGTTPIKGPENQEGPTFSKIRELPIIIIGWIGDGDDFFEESIPTRLAFVSFGICSEFIAVGVMKIQNPIIPIYRDPIIGYDAVDRLIRDYQKNIKTKYKEKINYVKHRKIKWTYNKTCENCQRKFISYRSDARACPRSACKKALSPTGVERKRKRQEKIKSSSLSESSKR